MATNEKGTDRASNWAGFQVTFHHIKGTDYIDRAELEKSDEIISEIRTFSDRFLKVGLAHPADGIASLVDSDSPTVRSIADEFESYNPNDREVLAKDRYYWVVWWLEYKSDWSTQWEIPVETIHDRDGVCINYAAVLASLYEAADLDAKVMALWNESWWGMKREKQHAALLLYLPGLSQGDYYKDEWLFSGSYLGGEGTEVWRMTLQL